MELQAHSHPPIPNVKRWQCKFCWGLRGERSAEVTRWLPCCFVLNCQLGQFANMPQCKHATPHPCCKNRKFSEKNIPKLPDWYHLTSETIYNIPSMASSDKFNLKYWSTWKHIRATYLIRSMTSFSQSLTSWSPAFQNSRRGLGNVRVLVRSTVVWIWERLTMWTMLGR